MSTRGREADTGAGGGSYGEGMTVAAMLDVPAFIAPFVWSGDLRLWPAPGQGPPDSVQKQGEFRAVVLASRVGHSSSSATDGAAAHTRLGAAAGRDGGESVARGDVYGRGDMGYALTSKLLAEVSLPSLACPRVAAHSVCRQARVQALQ